MSRQSKIKRKTNETDISLTLNVDGSGTAEVSTNIGFFDHMMTSLAKHSSMDVTLECDGDIEIDDHHTVEDCAIVLGKAFDDALGDKVGICRFGHAYAPLDEALARAVVDLSGRPYSNINLNLEDGMIGNMNVENVEHVLESFALNAKITLHIDVIKGRNNHHKAEAAFKALALAIKQAVSATNSKSVPSTKGLL